MIWIIARREVLANIFSLRFIFGLFIFLSAMISCAFVKIDNYKRNLNDYHLRVVAQEEFLKQYAHERRIGSVARPHMPPTRLSALVREIPVDLTKFAEEESIYDNPTNNLYMKLDIIFIIFIIGSLFAIILAYNSISGEKERGTLALVTSYSVSKAKMFFGKLLGNIITITIPFLLSLTLMSAIIFLNKQVEWKAIDWLSFYLIMVLALIYLYTFSILGVTISARFKRSSVSIIIALFTWVVFNLIIPNVSPFLSSIVYSLPSALNLTDQIKMINNEREEVLREKKRGYIAKGYSEAQAWELGNMDEVNNEFFQRISKVQEDFRKKAIYQVFIAKNISCLSPTACFIYSSLEISGGGFSRIGYAGQLFQTWTERALDYLDKKVKQIKRTNSDYTFDDFIDVTDGPRFVYKEQPLILRIKAGLPYVALMVFYSIILNIVSFIVFQKIDVR